MPNLFGIDIATEVNNAITAAGGLRPGVLSRVNPAPAVDPNNPNKVVKGNTTIHNFQGFVEGRTVTEPGTLIKVPIQVVSILGASINTEPQAGDNVVIDNVKYCLTDLLKVDPAQALYEFTAS